MDELNLFVVCYSNFLYLEDQSNSFWLSFIDCSFFCWYFFGDLFKKTSTACCYPFGIWQPYISLFLNHLDDSVFVLVEQDELGSFFNEPFSEVFCLVFCLIGTYFNENLIIFGTSKASRLLINSKLLNILIYSWRDNGHRFVSD